VVRLFTLIFIIVFIYALDAKGVVDEKTEFRLLD